MTVTVTVECSKIVLFVNNSASRMAINPARKRSEKKPNRNLQQNISSGRSTFSSYPMEDREGVAKYCSAGKAQWVHILAVACTPHHLPREPGHSADGVVAVASPSS